MRLTFPQITPAVKWLLITNIAVFFVQILGADTFLVTWFSIFPVSLSVALQLWRLITYQFLHGGLFHILFNMLILFFFGPMLERFWGSKKFLIFYLVCGATGGVLYPLLVLAGLLRIGPLIGASGAIFGMLAAGAILFPNLIVYVMGIFPLRLMVLAVILAIISIINLFGGQNAGGEAAHLAGMTAGAIYVFSSRWRAKFKLKIRTGIWEKKITAQQNLQNELDRILQKVHDSGIHSLTPKEKRMLKKATEAEQKRPGL